MKPAGEGDSGASFATGLADLQDVAGPEPPWKLKWVERWEPESKLASGYSTLLEYK
jgi:hypothetical protein